MPTTAKTNSRSTIRKAIVAAIAVAATIGSLILIAALTVPHLFSPQPWGRDAESDLSKKIPHNYFTLVNRNQEVVARYTEINGWLLLEALLLRNQNKELSSELAEAVEQWRGTRFAGWWPPQFMTQGKSYFRGADNLVLADDLDDTTWKFDYLKSEFSDMDLARFISNQMLPPGFHETCAILECRKDLILRIWAWAGWHDDLDLVTVANAISYIRPKTMLQVEIVAENKKLLNEMIREKIHRKHFRYFEPRISGTALILFYHFSRQPILDDDTLKILLAEYAEEKHELQERPLLSRWGGGADEEWFYGLNALYYNDNLSKLIYSSLEGLLETKK